MEVRLKTEASRETNDDEQSYIAWKIRGTCRDGITGSTDTEIRIF